MLQRQMPQRIRNLGQKDIFTYGQLYVVYSRVRKSENLSSAIKKEKKYCLQLSSIKLN